MSTTNETETDNPDKTKTKSELIAKLETLRGQIAQLTASKKRSSSKDCVLKSISADACHAIVESFPDGIVVHDLNGHIVLANQVFCDNIGYTQDELLQMNVSDIDDGVLTRQDRDNIWVRLKHSDSTRIQVVHRRKDGSTFPAEVFIRAITLNGASLLVTVSRNISKRKQRDMALRTGEMQLSNAIKIAKLGYWEYNVAEDMFVFNDYFYNIFRTSAEREGGYKMSSRRYAERFLHPDDVSMVAQEIKKALETDNPWFSRQLEHRIIYADGEQGHMSVRFFVVKDEEGRTVKTYGANQDITERKRAEAERTKLETQLRRSQRLETIGTLAGGIAHDFNNILTPIMVYAEVALDSLSAADPMVEDFHAIRSAALRARDLISQILTFSRKLDQERSLVDLPTVCQEALKLLRPSLPASIDIQQQIVNPCKKVRGDASQLHQVIVNLCTNAFQAMEQDGGQLTLELTEVAVDATTAKYHSNLKEGAYVRLAVADTGEGMDEPVLERIFEPFFTTKPVDKGSGMGLSVVHGIVESHDGAISVFSEKGVGSTFHVYLPARNATQSDAPRERISQVSVQRGEESILVVDDEVPVTNAMRRLLEKLGYRVTAMNLGLDAVKSLKLHPKRYDLIITDLTMPGMSGLELIRQVNRLDASLPTILMTGYGMKVTDEILMQHGVRHLIEKPIDMRSLATAVRGVLDGTDAAEKN